VTQITTVNLYGQYRFDKGSLAGTSIKLGVRNLANTQPPISSSGYQGELYMPYARYWYASVSHKF
jgi:outer membrane receptor protein involved in Fe transport